MGHRRLACGGGRGPGQVSIWKLDIFIWNNTVLFWQWNEFSSIMQFICLTAIKIGTHCVHVASPI